MNGNKLVLDSNFILDYLKGRPAHVCFMRDHAEHALWASVITEMELFSFHGLTDAEGFVLEAFMASVAIAPLDDRIKDTAIAFRRATRCKIPDSIIAATAIKKLVATQKAALRSV